MIKVQIIQPVIPEYRVSFFSKLAGHSNLRIRIYAAKKSATGDMKSVGGNKEFIHLNHEWIQLLGRCLSWQRRLSLDEDMESGDVLVVCGNPRFLSNYPLIWQAKRRKISVIWWGIGVMPNQNRLSFLIRRSVMKWADVVLLYSEREMELFRRYGFRPDRLFATNNTIDHEPIQSARNEWSPDRLTEFRARNGLDERKVLLYCGRLTKKPRLDLALKALAKLIQMDQGFLLAIVGSGEEKQELIKLAQTLNVTNFIRWVGPLYAENQLAPWFLSAECFVYPGSIGLSLMHAMSYGLPVITHDNIGDQPPEIAALEDKKNGLLFRYEDTNNLAAAISYICNHSEIASKMSKAASETIRNKYPMSTMLENFVDAINAAHKNARKE